MLTVDGIIDSLRIRRWLDDGLSNSVPTFQPNTESRFFQKIEIGPDGEPHIVPKEKDPKPSTTLK